MKLKSLFPVIATAAVIEARDFYMKYFGFVVEFDAGWYVQLHGPRDGGGMPLELAFMFPEHDALPPSLRHAFDGKGVFVTIEVEDVDEVYHRLRADGHEILIELRDEAWGQRHFGVRDPTGGMLDVVKLIPPSADYQVAFEGTALQFHLERSRSDPNAQ
ncbi:MAG: VOC family protein [Luteimonas sp.]